MFIKHFQFFIVRCQHGQVQEKDIFVWKKFGFDDKHVMYVCILFKTQNGHHIYFLDIDIWTWQKWFIYMKISVKTPYQPCFRTIKTEYGYPNIFGVENVPHMPSYDKAKYNYFDVFIFLNTTNTWNMPKITHIWYIMIC